MRECNICKKELKESEYQLCEGCKTVGNEFFKVKGSVSKPTKKLNREEYYLGIAKAVSVGGTCLRRNYGAIIVNNDEIISTGYTGAPRGNANCCDLGVCERQRLKIAPGERYELCKSVHAEQNAIISASRQEMLGATLYLYGYDKEKDCEILVAQPCDLCSRMIINAGISKVVAANYIWYPSANRKYIE